MNLPDETVFEKILVYKFGRLIARMYFYGLVFDIHTRRYKSAHEHKYRNLSYGKQSLDEAVS
jgi:predicted enzyme related to lactoylglutathione lyase